MKKIEELLARFSRGDIVIVMDDEKRENEADLIVAIDKLTPEKVNYLARYGRGLICAALSEMIIKNKGFMFMPSNKSDIHDTSFTLSVDSRKVKTGISVYDRYLTAKDLADPLKCSKDFISPGHLFPLSAKQGGLLERQGHTEAAVSICRLSKLPEAALICEMIGDDGNMFAKNDVIEFANVHNIPFCRIEELVEYEKLTNPDIKKIQTAALSTDYGSFDITIYEELYQDKEHVFMSMGDYKTGSIRIHSECLTGDIFSSRLCDCGTQLRNALQKISEDKKGAILYLRQEGRGIGLGEKIKAYNLQQTLGYDTYDANIHLGHKPDDRDYHQAAWILKDQGYEIVRLMTNNPHKISTLQKHGFVVAKEKINSAIYPENYDYLMTKKNKFGHLIDI